MSNKARERTLPQERGADLPVRRVTVNSLVAFNLAFFRKAAELTQEELGERLGWGNTVVSTAERSWDARRVRSFSVEDLMDIAMALGVPVAALFLPPEDHGLPSAMSWTAPAIRTWRLPTYWHTFLPRTGVTLQ